MPLYSSKPDTNKTLEVRFDCVYGILDTVVPKRAYTIVREDLLNFFRSELAREREEGYKTGVRHMYGDHFMMPDKQAHEMIEKIKQEATLAERNRIVKKLQGCLKYCREQNGLSYCKNCGLSADLISKLSDK